MRILSNPSGSVEILALGIELGDSAFMEFESSKVVGILEEAELGVERFRHCLLAKHREKVGKGNLLRCQLVSGQNHSNTLDRLCVLQVSLLSLESG